ncbi:MAG: glycosyltransferase family 4 protein [Bryobacteraceae bacterium]|nr:glycosyltransferase family 4 protein [Bryobacteraceae bacterium]
MIFLSVETEPNRAWSPDRRDLSVTVQKSLTISRTWRHPRGFAERTYTHIPLRTIRLLKAFRPDVILTAEFGARTILATVYRSMSPKTKLITWATVSEDTEIGRGHCRYWLRRAILRYSDAVLVNGASGGRYIAGLGFRRDKIFVAPYSVDEQFFKQATLDRTNLTLRRLLYVGRLEARKGLLPFLAALDDWLRSNPHQRIELWVIGDGPLRAELTARVVPETLTLRLFGNLDYERLPDAYQRCGMLAFPSLADEWGMVVSEAMACGLPVLGSVYSQAVQEMVVDDVTGWRFRTDCHSSIVQSITRAFSVDEGRLLDMASAARARALDFRPSVVADNIIKAIWHCHTVSC